MLSTATTILALLLPTVLGAPTHKRAEVCNLSLLPGVSVIAAGDSSGTTRWDLFTESGFDIQDGQLAWFQEYQPDQPATFSVIPTTDGPTIFTFQRQPDGQQVVINGNEFQAASSGGTEFIISCTQQCNTQATDRELAAAGCTMEISSNGTGTSQCVAWDGGAQTLVTTAPCDGSTSQQVLFFTADSDDE